jgi:hypothetical protein
VATPHDAFDASTDERFGFALKLPSQIFRLIVGPKHGVVGYQLSTWSERRTIRPMMLLLMVVWTVITVDILDLAAGRGQKREHGQSEDADAGMDHVLEKTNDHGTRPCVGSV